MRRNNKGTISFEVLISITIIGILIFTTVYWIERSRSIKAARDLTRFNDIQLLLSSLLLYQIDTHGHIPKEIDNDVGTWQLIGIAGDVCTTTCENRDIDSKCIYLPELVPDYIKKMPQDTFFSDLGPTGYYINKEKDKNIVTVGACNSELSASIELRQ